MKKALSIGLMALILGSGFYNFASAAQRIAVVDIPAVVSKSAQVQTLKKEHQAKMQNLDKWLKNAKADIAKQQTKEGKEKLLKKYQTEFAQKKEAITTDYQKKLKAVDTSITKTISTHAKLKGYDMVISKGVVIYGGDDITEEVQKVVK